MSGWHFADDRGEMGSLEMGTAVLVGAAGLALWVDVRLSNRSPGTVVKVIMHAVLASLAVRAGATLAVQLIDGSTTCTVVALCLVVLPGWVYAFLVSLWTMKLVRSAIPR